MAGYRMTADERGQTHLEPMDLSAWPFENGPGEFKGVGGAAMGDASRLMLMRFETGARPGFHRAVPGFLVVLSGELVVWDSTGAEVALLPGDTLRCETTGPGGWRLGNRVPQDTLVALVQMPPKRSAPAPEA
ncbi:MAG: hypothetical protein EPO16_06335 [Dehalococcoidia bacterium]|nr:MAG: hypothetical protein EPO16_06335 [Dehalococcoidia bacterium]